MAWNEPGNGNNGGSNNGNGNKDPWGKRNNQDGPPDLDELVKKSAHFLVAVVKAVVLNRLPEEKVFSSLVC